MSPASDPVRSTLGRREFLATACESAAALSLPLAPSVRGETSPTELPRLGNRLLGYYPFAETGAAGLRNHAPGIDGMHAARFGGAEFDASAHPSGSGFRGMRNFRAGDHAGPRPASPTGLSLNLVAARNDALVVPVSAATLGRDFTIALWHWLAPGCTVARPFVFEGADNHHVSWGIGRGDHYAAYVTQARIFPAGALPRGRWVHCAHVFSSDGEKTTLRLFLDGKLTGTAEGSMLSLHFPALHFGKHRGGDTSRQWDGMLYGHFHANYMKRHGETGIHSIQAAPPDMGGINHSPSNFVAYEIDPAGAISAEPRYNYLDQHLVVVTPAESGSPAATADGRLAVSINTYSAHAATTGEVKWRSTAWNAGYGSVGEHTLAGDTLVVGANWSAIYAHNRHTGARTWTAGQDGLRFQSASGLWHDGVLIMTGNERVARFNAATGELLSIHPLPYSPTVSGRPLIAGDLLVLGTAKHGIAAFHRETMKEAWRHETGEALVYTAAYSRAPSQTVESGAQLVAGDIIVGASDGQLRALDPATGRARWAFNLGAPILGTPRVDGSPLFVSDFSGNLTRIELS